ncbi:unnamed protein product [Protopolystoma xenopodis]|uniref:Uncharacterized protein n=1 Tax=Protopolystoma xenopodis TaxID=117903 RepID=A0A3S5BCG7_9PLAT|nr:unnamed protein product [Protopolystoma xenopodis]
MSVPILGIEWGRIRLQCYEQPDLETITSLVSDYPPSACSGVAALSTEMEHTIGTHQRLDTAKQPDTINSEDISGQLDAESKASMLLVEPQWREEVCLFVFGWRACSDYSGEMTAPVTAGTDVGVSTKGSGAGAFVDAVKGGMPGVHNYLVRLDLRSGKVRQPTGLFFCRLNFTLEGMKTKMVWPFVWSQSPFVV